MLQMTDSHVIARVQLSYSYIIIITSNFTNHDNDQVIKRLPAAPGMTTTTTTTVEEEESSEEEVLVHCYSPYNDMYLVSRIDTESKEHERFDIVTSLSINNDDATTNTTATATATTTADATYNNEVNNNNTSSVKYIQLKSNIIQFT